MTFLELATAIDEAEKEIAEAAHDVNLELEKVEQLKAQHIVELASAQSILSRVTETLKSKNNRLANLFTQLNSKIPGNTIKPQAEPSTSDLKKLFQDGQQYRSKLG